MNKKICFVFSLLILGYVVFAQGISLEEARLLLEKAQNNTAFYESDLIAHYTIVQENPGSGKSMTDADMYRRDREKKWTALITGPSSEKGKGYLQFDGNIWFFDPTDKRFTFTSAKDKFQGTNANNSDFMPQKYYSSYSIESATPVVLGKLNCVLFNLKAKGDDVDYPFLKLWVTRDDGLVRKKEDYSKSGQLLRTSLIPSYQIVEGNGRKNMLPVKMLIVDNLRGKKIDGKMQYERTQISISNAVFKNEENIVYSKPFLEMMSVK